MKTEISETGKQRFTEHAMNMKSNAKKVLNLENIKFRTEV